MNEDEESVSIDNCKTDDTPQIIEVGMSGLHPAIYIWYSPDFFLSSSVFISTWIALSCAVILFNKYLLHTAGFPFPIFLTTCHLTFATIVTRILSNTTNLLADLNTITMNQRLYMTTVVPLGLVFTISLVCCNVSYLYLSVSFIRMLKATSPVAVLLISILIKKQPHDAQVLAKVTVIVIGVIIVSYGEFDFVFVGFLFQAVGTIAEATRLVLAQRLLDGLRIGPLAALYYLAPICAILTGAACLIFEAKTMYVELFMNVGLHVLLLNAVAAFGLNVAAICLIGKTSSLVMCLSGVIKDILLITASILIWATPITSLQIFGYAVALGGLVCPSIRYTGKAHTLHSGFSTLFPRWRQSD
ncbi:triose-phosphate transporter family-domain-containing protein [Blyttiomyces helicus]|uniref:Triose-phosphate transporter family-domain-containing protein n=1 Tax=Blyttiomyces helicus TaxID=388810 RepID=A0A4P9WNS6_9FUNG|nr:triose-phosphate transporter family-domain-containing protein [Blyttiomyces helicus]|eukprot:RKO94791.1 triose-phosphate transporter family-domain-containing protein [Blyttiomyces helicus]